MSEPQPVPVPASASAPIHLVIPGPIDTLTGGFIYDRHMAEALRRAGRLGEAVCLEGAYPRPNTEDLARDRGRIEKLDPAATLVIDGLALTALAGGAAQAPWRGPSVALIHHPLCDETGLGEAGARELFLAEKAALESTHGCIVTSPATARRMRDFALPGERVRVVIPGLDQPATPVGRKPTAHLPTGLLCVASLSPRKGQDSLLKALLTLTDLDWRLDLVGAARDPDFAARIERMITEPALKDRVRLLGEVDGEGLNACYRDADLFVLPSHHEGFGMALSEAMAHGLAIISTTAGAIPETVPEGAGALVTPGDTAALARCLRRFIEDPAARARAGCIAGAAAAKMPSWAQTGADFITAVDTLRAPR